MQSHRRGVENENQQHDAAMDDPDIQRANGRFPARSYCSRIRSLWLFHFRHSRTADWMRFPPQRKVIPSSREQVLQSLDGGILWRS